MSVVAGETPPTHVTSVVNRLRLSPEISDVAQAFVSLYARRESADYDHSAAFDKKTTLLDIGVARRAVDLSFQRRDTEEFRAFAGLVALRLNIDRRP